MRQHASISPLIVLLCLGIAPAPAPAATLELALVIDGSSSISTADWNLQIGAYQTVFQDKLYTKLVQPGPFDTLAVAAYVFSGGVAFGPPGGPQTEIGVFSFIPWTMITNDADASAFGAQFAGLPQPNGTTATAEALNTAAFGGDIGCPFPDICNVDRGPFPGLNNNGIAGDRQVIDISTDGVPTEPNGNGTPNAQDDALAIAAADAARAAGIVVNAIGVGGVDSAFLNSLVGIAPASMPAGFVETALTFSDFENALRTKLSREVAMVPVPGALPLLLSALGGLAFWRRRVT